MGKNHKKGLGLEWVIAYLDYYSSLSIRTALREILLPIAVSLVCSFIYLHSGIAERGLRTLADILPSIIAILIGFSVMVLTILTTSDNNKLEKVKTGIIIRNQEITYHQLILIRSTHTLFNEIALLLIVFVYMFFHGLDYLNNIWSFLFLAIEAYLIISILISIFTSMVNIYCAYFDKGE